MSRAENKADRLLQIEALLLSHAQGLTQSQIAQRLGVDRSVIHRNLFDFEKRFPVIRHDDGRIAIDRSAYLVKVSFSLHESLAIHLASRLLSTRMDRQNPNAASALRKLGLALERLAPRISQHVQQSADVMDEAEQRQDPGYLEALERLTIAWAEQRKAQVWHRSEASGKVLVYVFSPYFIEPYAVGQTTHLIGHSEPPGKTRTLKIERIERVELTRESYQIPADFDPRSLLADAWGIWYTESEPQEIVLKFHPRVARRVQETSWHRSQQVNSLPDGFLLWRVKVAEPQEMLPWIRGWGADVEVLEPYVLRQALEHEARKLARLYKLEGVGNIPKYFSMWAKTDKEHGTDKLHPLIYHMLDVGECALALWQYALSDQTRQAFAGWLGLDIENSGRQLAFWASLHDLGKAAPGFQRKYQPAIPILEKEGFVFPAPTLTPAHHGILSTWALLELLTHETGIEASDARKIAFALGGHHGAWPTNDRIQSPALQSSDKGDGLWDAARKDLLLIVKDIYQPVNAVSLPKDQAELNTFLTLFSGMVSVADWIGSMTEHFSFVDDYLPARKYVSKAQHQAKVALGNLGWLGWQTDGTIMSFAEMFPLTPLPREIQSHTIDATSNLELPALIILEAPTGIGKTEVALYLADTWVQSRKGKGIYIAMPTQATSNQMFGRVVDFLQKRYPDQIVNTHLVHGAALLEENEETPHPEGIALDDKAAEGNVKAETWFLPRKRTLLAPFGVGTVDQVLMSVLQTNHFFVRMFGLGQKVIIFDEVHAYDTYMSTLFQRLLRWLRSIGTSVILLSATLSDKTRQELAGAWLGNDEILLPEAAYPRVTIASAGKVNVVALPAPKSRSLQLAWIDPTPEQIAGHLAEKLKDGGCAAVICNRVQRAQEVYEALKSRGIVEAENLILFHARFPFEWRNNIEKRVLKIFGKDKDFPSQANHDRPKKAIVVATQVIEQSLDLDFDYMLTDLAPVDLLLQRAGRLHRHKKNDAARPAGLQNPIMAISLPEMIDEQPEFGYDIWIYDKVTLLCTWLYLQGRSQLILPEQTVELIESVYGDRINGDLHSKKYPRELEKSKQQMLEDQNIAKAKAKNHLIPSPDSKLVGADNLQLDDEENPNIHDAFRAATRLASPGVSIICLHRVGEEIALDSDGKGSGINLSRQPYLQEAKKFLKYAVNIQNYKAVPYFVEKMNTLSAGWKKSALVRYHYPVVFNNGKWDEINAPFTMELSPEFGLKIFSKEAK